METKRIIIYPKDVQRITGKSERFGRMLLKQIKQQLSKEEHQFVTVHEFCKYAGIDVQEISDFIKD
ncbi:MAG: hypothetical protein ACP5PZ_00765 [Bacteroidales bacterium]